MLTALAFGEQPLSRQHCLDTGHCSVGGRAGAACSVATLQVRGELLPLPSYTCPESTRYWTLVIVQWAVKQVLPALWPHCKWEESCCLSHPIPVLRAPGTGHWSLFSGRSSRCWLLCGHTASERGAAASPILYLSWEHQVLDTGHCSGAVEPVLPALWPHCKWEESCCLSHPIPVLRAPSTGHWSLFNGLLSRCCLLCGHTASERRAAASPILYLSWEHQVLDTGHCSMGCWAGAACSVATLQVRGELLPLPSYTCPESTRYWTLVIVQWALKQVLPALWPHCKWEESCCLSHPIPVLRAPGTGHWSLFNGLLSQCCLLCGHTASERRAAASPILYLSWEHQVLATGHCSMGCWAGAACSVATLQVRGELLPLPSYTCPESTRYWTLVIVQWAVEPVLPALWPHCKWEESCCLSHPIPVLRAPGSGHWSLFSGRSSRCCLLCGHTASERRAAASPILYLSWEHQVLDTGHCSMGCWAGAACSVATLRVRGELLPLPSYTCLKCTRFWTLVIVQWAVEQVLPAL